MISLLFLASDPTDLTRLRAGQELREIQEKLQLSKARDQFSLQTRMSVRPSDLTQAMLDLNPQIVHFSGHGASSGVLAFEDRLGQAHPVHPEALAALFEQFTGQIQCVVLNACYSAVQARAIAQYVPYVIGMSQQVSDQAALAFTVGFYQALGAGRSYAEAFKLGCVQMRLENIPEHLTPQLLQGQPVASVGVPVVPPTVESTPPPQTAPKMRVEPPAVLRPTNLGFEGPAVGGKPDGWFNGDDFVGGVSTAYQVSVIPRSDGEGFCATLGNLQASADDFGVLMQCCPVGDLAGKAIRIQAEIRCAAADSVGLWLRVDDLRLKEVFFENMSERPLHSTTPWTRCTIDAYLPPQAVWLNYGVLLIGKGRLWVDNFRVLFWENEAWQPA